MQQLDQFKSPVGIENVIERINNSYDKPIKIMEICGTHTMAIAKTGIKTLLRNNIKLISGPGCPVCVTPQDRIDSILKLSMRKEVVIATYGDMLRVPGTRLGESLQNYRAKGASVEIVYSAMDAIELAKNNKNKEIIFLGIGFETTTPTSAIALKVASEENINNFTLFSMHKRCEPVLRTLIGQPDFDVDGFLCPGNVSIIIGEKGFEFIPMDYNIPAVITGFEGGDIITAIYKILEMLETHDIKLVNEYSRIAKKNGNEMAKVAIQKYFEPCDDLWRGIGLIPESGLKIKDEYKKFDATYKFDIELSNKNNETECICGGIIMGKYEPDMCSAFGGVCTPDNPIGPCMVSSEGACAAKYKYGEK